MDGSEEKKYPGAGRSGLAKDDFNFSEVFRFAIRHRILFLVSIFCALGAATIEHQLFPSFKARATLLIASSSNNPLKALTAKLSGLVGDSEAKESTDRLLLHLRSFDFFLRSAAAIRKEPEFVKLKSLLLHPPGFHLRSLFQSAVGEVGQKELSDEKIALGLMGWVNFVKDGNETLGVVVTTPDRHLTLMLSNFLAGIAVTMVTDYELKEIDDAAVYLKTQLDEAQKEITNIDSDIVEFKKSNRVFSINSNERESEFRVLDIQRQLAENSINLEENAQLIETMRTKLKAQQPDGNQALTLAPGSYKFGLPQKVISLERERQYLSVRHDVLKKMLDKLLSSNDQHYDQRVFDLRKRMELQYSLFQEVKKQIFQIEMRRIVVKNTVRFFEEAREFAVKRSQGLPSKLLVALLLAFVAGAPLAYARELYMPTLKTRQDMADVGLSFIGSIPELKIPMLRDARGNWRKDKVQERSLMCRFDTDSNDSMAFIHVRTRLLGQSQSTGKASQIISIVSSREDEGKSFVARNLAACIAHMGKRTLLIDCDIRKDSRDTFFLSEHRSGLGEVLLQTEKFGSVVHRSVLPQLDVLSPGKQRSDVTELFAGTRFSELLHDLREVYQHIVLDTPSFTVAPDSALISRQSDLIVWIALHDRSGRDQVARDIDELMSFEQRRVFGIINRVNTAKDFLYVRSATDLDRRSGDRRMKIV